jgi:hypothetical protein
MTNDPLFEDEEPEEPETPPEFEELFDALVNYTCTSRQDIADATGWSTYKVGYWLGVIRTPEVSAVEGWTVPHVARGLGEHLYFPMYLEDDRPLSEEEDVSMREGLASTCLVLATEGRNESHAVTPKLQYLTGAERRAFQRMLAALDGAVANAELAYEIITRGNGSASSS